MLSLTEIGNVLSVDVRAIFQRRTKTNSGNEGRERPRRDRRGELERARAVARVQLPRPDAAIGARDTRATAALAVPPGREQTMIYKCENAYTNPHTSYTAYMYVHLNIFAASAGELHGSLQRR